MQRSRPTDSKDLNSFLIKSIGLIVGERIESNQSHGGGAAAGVQQGDKMHSCLAVIIIIAIIIKLGLGHLHFPDMSLSRSTTLSIHLAATQFSARL